MLSYYMENCAIRGVFYDEPRQKGVDYVQM